MKKTDKADTSKQNQAFKKAEALLKVHEGLRLKPYKCTSGKLTIGYGRNLDDNGITEQEAQFMLDRDVRVTVNSLAACLYDDFLKLEPIRQAALIDMCYNLGLTRFLTFKKMLFNLAIDDYDSVADELLDSRYAKQVKGRANTLATILRTGKHYA